MRSAGLLGHWAVKQPGCTENSLRGFEKCWCVGPHPALVNPLCWAWAQAPVSLQLSAGLTRSHGREAPTAICPGASLDTSAEHGSKEPA